MRHLISLTCAALAAISLFGALLYYNIFYALPANQSFPAEVRVEQGDSLATVARKLRERSVVTNGWFFSLWARFSGAQARIHHGLYRFDSSVTAREVLDRLVTGKGVFQTVTIPEGLTVKEIAELLAAMQISDKETFLKDAADPSLLATLDLQDKGIEGYLFPSTYNFTPGTPAREIIIKMAEQFRKISLPFLRQDVSHSKLSPHEILTLASIIEKETGIQQERELVSAVFHNRLRLRMPLQSDPTVIYGLKNFDGNLSRKHLQDESPYNTYRIAALPPGPICNPSLASIKAAVRPADVPYLYFVSKNDGTHLFSETIEAHNRAVKTLQPIRHNSTKSTKLARRR